MKGRMTGSGLIEVLIALLVLGIGLVGLLSAQLGGVKSSQRAEYMTEAHLLATDMINIISAYDAFDDSASQRFVKLDSSAPFQEVDCKLGCSREQQYQFAGFEWSRQLRRILPSGQGVVSYDESTQLFTIKIMWDEDGSGSTGSGCSGDIDVDLSCYVIEVQI